MTEELKKSEEDLANLDLLNSSTEQKSSLALKQNRIAAEAVAGKLNFSLSEKDFVAWSDEQALLLEQQRYEELDLANLVEEVKDLGNRHRDVIESQLTRLLMHLLKYAEFRKILPKILLGNTKRKNVVVVGRERLRKPGKKLLI